jgi:hypothetical protein
MPDPLTQPPTPTPPPPQPPPATPPPTQQPQQPQGDPIDEFIGLPHDQQLSTLQQLAPDKQDALLNQIKIRQQAKLNQQKPPAQQSSYSGPVDAQGNPIKVPSLPQQLSNAGNQIKGFIKGAGQSTAGAINVLNNRIPARGDPGDVPALTHVADWISSHSKPNNAEQSKGEFVQSALELAGMGMAGEGAAAKGVEELPAASELVGEVGKKLKLLESDSTLARIVRVGLDAIKGGARGAVEQGVQTGVKTGDPEQAGHAAKVGAAFGAVGGGVGSAANETAGAIEAARPVGRDIAGAKFPTSKGTGEAMLRPVKEAGAEPATQAVDEAVGNMGKTAVANSLNRANAARAPETPPPASTPPAEIPPRLPQWIITSDGQATSIGKARANLAQYNRVLNDDGIVDEMGTRQHQQLVTQRDDLAEQLSRYDNAAATQANAFATQAAARTAPTDYAASQPHFDVHDVLGAVQNTDSLGQGGQVLKDSAAPFWEKADAASGGRFSELREDEKSLEQRFNRDPTANLADVRTKMGANRQAMMDWFDEHKAEFSRKEWETHRDLYQDGIVTSNLNTMIQSRFNGINRAEVAQPLEHAGSTIKRIFQPGNDFNQEIENFYNEGNNREVLERTIGRAHMNDIKNMGQLFEGAQREKATATLMQQIGAAYRHHRYVGGGVMGGGIGGTLGYGLGHGAGAIAAGTAAGSGIGAVVGGLTTGTLRFIGDKLASDPEFLKSFSYAVKNNVSPRFAAPLLVARMMAGTQNTMDRQDKEVVPADEKRGVQSVTLPVETPK